MNSLCCLLYCRPGFEKETASEIMQQSQLQGIQGYVKAKSDSAYICFYPTAPLSMADFNQSIRFKPLIFARQSLFVSEMVKNLPSEDRITPLLTAIKAIEPDPGSGAHLGFNDVFLETPDTNEGKQLSGFCKKFSTPLRIALEKNQLIDNRSKWRLHLFFLNSATVYVGISYIDNSAAHSMGITRLRFPASAPSRSTLKLEEAFKTLLSTTEQEKYLRNGMTAVDLGACPGGWTWQLVRRGIRVSAIDNGSMDQALMDSGLVREIKADGFKYVPKPAVDWLVCDMVERPKRIAQLIARWFTAGHCQYAAFNLKLPMKKRFDMVMQCQSIIEAELNQLNRPFRLDIKHLYHDREEVTCVILLL